MEENNSQNNSKKVNKALQKIKNILKKWWVWLIIAILIVSITVLINILTKPKFKIVDFEITKELTEFTYSDDSVSYSGKGKITTKDTKGVYLIALKQTLLQGRYL